MTTQTDNRDRDRRGRFTRGNQAARAGGLARAAALDAGRRQEIARTARRAMVDRHFHGDDAAQRRYFGELGAYVYDQAAGAGRPGSPLRPIARHPGPISGWIIRHATRPALDVDFYAGAARREARS